MDKIRIDDVEPSVDSATLRRSLTDALNATELALNYYELAPGDSFAYGYHAHDRQEELFVVQQGEVTFETEAGDVIVEEGEVIRFAPGEYQQGTNRGEERVVGLAIGAPKDGGDLDLRRECPACGERTSHTVERLDDTETKITRCLGCGRETGRFD